MFDYETEEETKESRSISLPAPARPDNDGVVESITFCRGSRLQSTSGLDCNCLRQLWRFGFAWAVTLSLLAAEPEVDLRELPHFPPVEPAAAMNTFKVREGFKMELAASEPNIASPVAICFDENGRMFVVEMRDYSEHRDERLGRIRMLEDTDGDGVFEKSTIFAEGLGWPTAAICYDGGIFVGSTPDIIFLRDTNGDGKADERRVVFTGFGKGQERLNVQQLFNSFTWGLDNRIHGATAGNGGMIEQVASGAPLLRLGSRDFSFDPRTLTMRAETGGGQHGLSFDDFGRKFICSNSSHIRMAVYEDRYLPASTAFSLAPGAVDIAREGPAAEVFRISPEEPWRTIRTRWRVAGEVPGPIEGGGRASGYFTGATGVTIYRGDAYPSEFSNNAFVGDAGGNLVHRKILKETGVLFEASRPGDELNREFVASRDTWFRPVQFANAPDGCLYVIDMYREVIEHPWSLPPNLKKHIDLDNGRERGRIWRIAPENFKHSPAPKLGRAATTELIAALDSRNGWTRDTASRLLFQHHETDAAPLLRKVKSPAGKVHALWALAGLNQLDHESVKSAFKAEPPIIENALRCFELLSPADREDLAPELSKLIQSTSRVRHQLAWSIGASGIKNRAALLAQIISTEANDPWIRSAVLISAGDETQNLFTRLLDDSKFVAAEGAIDFLALLASALPAESLSERLTQAMALKDRAAAYRIVAALAEAMNRRKLRLDSRLDPLFEEAAKATSDPERLATLRLMRFAPATVSRPVFENALKNGKSDLVRVEAFRGLIENPRAAATALLENWNALPTSVRQRAIDLLVSRNEGPAFLIDALKKAQITRGDLTASQIQTLRQHGNPAISRPALEIFGKIDADRAAVIERFRPALEMKGDVKLGEKLFTERCATCHRITGRGFAVGPDLESVRGNGREYLLTHLIDPNREVNSRFVAYTAQLREGETVTGLLARETDGAVTLKLANAEEKTIPRAQISKLTASAQSLMPVGLEEGLDVAALAGLLDFLQTAR